jgi:hypothetical protein
VLCRRTHPAADGQTLLQVQRPLHLLGNCPLTQQNYNQLYHAYHEKTAELARLSQEIDHLRRDKLTQKPVAAPEESFFKERYLLMERGMEEMKAEVRRDPLSWKEAANRTGS